ncbi:MAG: ABC transporter substrate-binding protein [Leptolyngbya sp. SIOISBB]|nr:ABC transporter substrate-binding protein [Leptolyngbya sp. SIOISBB]
MFDKWPNLLNPLLGKKLRMWKRLGMAIAACLLAISCAATPLQPLRISSVIWLGYEPLFLARDLGYYDDAPIQIIEDTDHVGRTKRFLNGDVELTTTTLDGLLDIATLQDEMRALLIMDFSDGADAMIAQPEIERISDLKGKTIGILPSLLGRLVLTRTLESAELTIDDVQIIDIDSHQQEEAFKAKEVDATTTYEPVASRLRAEGGNIIFDSSQMRGEIVDLLVGHKDVVVTHKKEIEILLAGWFKALDYIQTNPDDAIARISEHVQLTPEQVRTALEKLHYLSLEENIAVLNKTDQESLDGMRKLAQFLEDRELLKDSIDPTQLLDARSVETL